MPELAGPGWSVADRSHPAFAISQLDKSDKSDDLHDPSAPVGRPQGLLRWSNAGRKADRRSSKSTAPAPNADASSPWRARPRRAGCSHIDASELEAAGIIESKFGTIALLRPAGTNEGAGGCLGFLKRIDDPALQISGWSCQGDNLPARRAAIGCMLNRLTLLTSGNEPKLAELFAQAELKRGNCASSPSDWITGAENPHLRGAF